jgi:hypothetical protein
LNVNNEQISDYLVVGYGQKFIMSAQILVTNLDSAANVAVPPARLMIKQSVTYAYHIESFKVFRIYFNLEYDNALRLQVAGIRFYKRSPHTSMNSAKVDSFTIGVITSPEEKAPKA